MEVDFTPVLNAFVPWTRKKKRRHLRTKDSTGGKCDSTCLEKAGVDLRPQRCVQDLNVQPPTTKASSPLHDKMLEIRASLEQTQVWFHMFGD